MEPYKKRSVILEPYKKRSQIWEPYKNGVKSGKE